MFALLVLLITGPRISIVLWWLIEPGRWQRAFSFWLVPLLGFGFLPWTTLMFVIVAPHGDIGSNDLLWLALALLMDISWTGLLSFRNRGRRATHA